MIYGLLAGGVPPQPPPMVVDVRDVAKAHVAALDVPRATALQDKRFVVNATNYTWKEAAAHLNAVRPSLKTAALGDFPALPGPASTLDNGRSVEVLGLEYIGPGKMVEDAVDSLLEAQKSWV
jgi:nucleoside-diphosphate-sugar epimerase